MEKIFGGRLLRLKSELGVQSDKEVAAFLGLSDKAFSARKKRDVFPDDDVYALAAKRPDLSIDVDYVLTGRPSSDISKMAAGIGERMEAIGGLGDCEDVKEFISRNPGVDAQWLLTGVPVQLKGELSVIEKILIENFRSASDEGKGALSALGAYFASRERKTKSGKR